eukprot:comp21137_c0_seq1/m.28590 comp21137_c0_seq1/g.28590  ORF comp21137_c0_seq1/g.28590 comp21137_c0_seq1/m.28590 type:complete len:328 (+) comp21137_c0_seq1:115-1098(+)
MGGRFWFDLALVTVTETLGDYVVAHVTKGEGFEGGNHPLVLSLCDLFDGHLGIGTPLKTGQETDALQHILEIVECVLDLGALCHRVKSHRARHLVVSPVFLHEGSQVQLLPHADVTEGPHAHPNIDRERNDTCARVDDIRFYMVTRFFQLGNEFALGSKTDTTELESAVWVVHTGGGSSKKRHGATRLDTCLLLGWAHTKLFRVPFVTFREMSITLFKPFPQFLEPSVSNELSNTRHAGANAAIALHDFVGLGPMNVGQGDGFCVKESQVECVFEVFEGFVFVGEGLHKTAQFEGFQSLLQARVSSHSGPILVILNAIHTTVCLHVF